MRKVEGNKRNEWSMMGGWTERERRRRGRGSAPLDGNWELPRARDRLHHDVGLVDAALEQLRLGARQQGLDDGVVPPRVDDADAQRAAVVDLRGGAFVVDHCFFCYPAFVEISNGEELQLRVYAR